MNSLWDHGMKKEIEGYASDKRTATTFPLGRLALRRMNGRALGRISAPLPGSLRYQAFPSGDRLRDPQSGTEDL
jgi:hypothetical protein